jgi:hypothetical protein
MTVHRAEGKSGQEPSKWKIEKFAEIGGNEEFVKQIHELLSIVDALYVSAEQHDKIREDVTSVLVDGLMPAFSELQSIRASGGRREVPMMNRLQLYEDLARKLWKAYKELMKSVVRSLGFEIGFLFQDDKKFRAGLANFRTSHPLLGKLRPDFEQFLEGNRDGWQKQLGTFRNEWVEHQTGDRRRFNEFYEPETAESLFDCTWRTIVDLLVPLLEVHLPHGSRLVEQHPDDPGPRWPNRFRYQLPPEYKFE